MEEKYEKIIKHFGINNQLKKFNEECYELIEAIRDYEKCCIFDEFKVITCRQHLIEELSDVLNLVNQFKKYYKIDDIELNNSLEYKVNRTLNRINEKYYEKENSLWD